MIRFISLLLVLAMTLAGCADSTTDDEESSPDTGASVAPGPEPANQDTKTPSKPSQPATEEVEATEPEVQVYETDVDLVFLGTQGLPTGNSNFASEGHCAYVFLPPGTKIVSGNATAMWSPQSSLVDELRFRAYSPDDGYDVRADETGASPLSISFGAFALDELWLALHVPGPALTVNQEATMHVQFEYLGKKSPRLDSGPCWHPTGP